MVSPDTTAPVSPPVILTSLQDTSAEEGESAKFHCCVSGDGKAKQSIFNVPRKWLLLFSCEVTQVCFDLPDLKITWYFRDKEIVQSDNYSMSQFDDTCQLEIFRAYTTDAGEYTCVARNSGGMVSCSGVLTINGMCCKRFSRLIFLLTLSFHCRTMRLAFWLVA